LKTSLRLELYDSLKSIIGVDRKNASYFSKLMALGLAGAIESVAGSPFDVLKTRMMAYEGSKKRGFRFYASEMIKKKNLQDFIMELK